MAVNPNFTNANSTTPYSGVGGGSNFPSGLNVGGVTLQGGGQAFVIQPAKEIFLGDGIGGTALYQVSSIQYVNSVMGASPFLFLSDPSPGKPNFRLLNLSTITAQDATLGSDINIGALTSTLKSVYPGCVG